MSNKKMIDEALAEIDRTSNEKSLDEALDEMDKWGERVSKAINSLSTTELRKHFRQVQAGFEKLLDKELKVVKRPPRRKKVRK